MPLPSALQLLVLSGPDTGATLPLGDGKYVVGKSPSCDLVLRDKTVSRRHLEVTVTGGAVHLRDLQSKNGSFYRDVRFFEVDASAGAIVTIGATELKIAPARRSSALPPSSSASFGGLRGASLPMRQVYALLECVSGTDTSVLLHGETGTGKDLAAESIHQAGKRANGPFVVCDLAVLPASLIESELFGHVAGAFTGADHARTGAFEHASGGTLFLDEVAGLDLPVQACLLRAIERRQIKPVGANRHRDVDVRIIAATSRDLVTEVKAGRFRLDLYHRLAVVQVDLPPLRERLEDVPTLVAAFAEGRAEVTPEVLSLLAAYDWPGNVRELRNVIERACALCPPDSPLRPDFLGPLLQGAAPVAACGGSYRTSRRRLISDWELQFLRRLLWRAGGNVAEAARLGGIDRAQLHRLLRKHGLKQGAEG